MSTMFKVSCRLVDAVQVALWHCAHQSTKAGYTKLASQVSHIHKMYLGIYLCRLRYIATKK